MGRVLSWFQLKTIRWRYDITEKKKEKLKRELILRHNKFLNSSLGKEMLANSNPRISFRLINYIFARLPITLSEMIEKNR